MHRDNFYLLLHNEKSFNIQYLCHANNIIVIYFNTVMLKQRLKHNKDQMKIRPKRE